ARHDGDLALQREVRDRHVILLALPALLVSFSATISMMHPVTRVARTPSETEGAMRVNARDRRGYRPERTVWCVVVVGVVLMGAARPAQAILTTPTCLAKKLSEWGSLRKCRATEEGKRLRGKSADAASCQRRFDATLATLNARATAAGIACRYQVNGDGTVTDYDTGLQWEQKTADGTTVHD